MLALVLLVCFASLALAVREPSDESVSGLLERVADGKKIVFDLANNRPVTSEDDDDGRESSLSSSELEEMLLALRAEQKERRAANKAAGKVEANRLRGVRESYQAKFSCSECATNNVALGPVVIIAKNTTADVKNDGFDNRGFDNSQNPLPGPDGRTDVKQTLQAWQEQTNAAGRDKALENFLLQVRNRAKVNGGSIGLNALVLSGKVKAANGADTATDATFGGTAGRVLITPCFPVVDDTEPFPSSRYNLQVYGEATNQNALFELASSVSLDDFRDAADEFVDVTASFALKIFADDDDDASDNDIVGLSTATFGSVVFEKCTAFSYFM